MELELNSNSTKLCLTAKGEQLFIFLQFDNPSYRFSFNQFNSSFTTNQRNNQTSPIFSP